MRRTTEVTWSHLLYNRPEHNLSKRPCAFTFLCTTLISHLSTYEMVNAKPRNTSELQNTIGKKKKKMKETIPTLGFCNSKEFVVRYFVVNPCDKMLDIHFEVLSVQWQYQDSLTSVNDEVFHSSASMCLCIMQQRMLTKRKKYVKENKPVIHFQGFLYIHTLSPFFLFFFYFFFLFLIKKRIIDSVMVFMKTSMQTLYFRFPLISVAAPGSLILQNKISDGVTKNEYCKYSL